MENDVESGHIIIDNDVVAEYVRIANDNELGFDKLTVLLPKFIYDIVRDESLSVRQVKMNVGIIISCLINEYLEHIENIYNVDSSKLEEEREKYVKRQLPITLLPDTVYKIEKIKRITGIGDRSTVIKSAIEYLFLQESMKSANCDNCNCDNYKEDDVDA